MPDVVAEVEPIVIDPDRVALERNPSESLTVARNEVELGCHVSADPIDVDAAAAVEKGASLEDGHPSHVHVGVARLESDE